MPDTRTLEARYCILAIGLICLAILWKFAGVGYFTLPWPGRQILPGILEQKGLLQGDFFAESAGQTPYDLSTSLAAMLFSDTREVVVMQFSLYSALIEILSLSLTTVLIYRLLVLLLGQASEDGRTLVPLTMPIIALYLFAASNDLLNLTLPMTALWSLPLDAVFNPQGFSWVMSVTALLIWRFEKPADRCLLRRTIAILLILLATFCHPVIPATMIVIGAIAAILNGRGGRSLLWAVSGFTLAWAIGVAAILVLYAEAPIPAGELFAIYVQERHPHHYLPSSYVDSAFWWNFSLFFIFGLAGLVLLQRLSWISGTVLFLAATLPHLMQFIFVELLQIPAAIKFGPSRLSYAYNVIVVALIAGGIFAALIRRPALRAGLVALRGRRVTAGLQAGGIVLVGVSIALLVRGHLIAAQDSFATSPARQVSEALDNAGLGDRVVAPLMRSPREARILNRIHWRETGGLPVFFDNYFPFSEQAMQIWYARSQAIAQLSSCLSADRAFDACTGNFDDGGNDILLLSMGALTPDSVPVLERGPLTIFATTTN